MVSPALLADLRRACGEDGVESIEVQNGARAIFEETALDGGFPEFFTLPAYERLT